MAIRSVELIRQPRDRPLRAAWLQQAFCDFERELDGDPVFHLPMAATVRGPLDRDALGEAITRLVARHETLRTTFAPAGGELDQHIAAPAAIALPCVAAASLPAAMALASRDARARFALDREPPLRPRLYRIADDEHLVSLELHHVAVDSWSLAILWDELWRGYRAARDGSSLALPDHPFDYADFAAWHRAQAPRLGDELGFWRAVIGDGIPTLALPVDRARSAATRYRGDQRQLAIPDDLAHGLAALARARGATPAMAYHAAFQAMLAGVSGQTDFGVCTPISTLSQAQRQAMVGPFLNLLPIRADVSGAPSFVELLARVRRASIDAGARRQVPWTWLLALAPPGPPGVSPHAQVMYNYLTADPDPPAGEAAVPPELAVSSVSIAIGAVELDLGLTIFASERETTGYLEYKTALFEPGTIDRLLGELVGVIAAAVRDPQRRLA